MIEIESVSMPNDYFIELKRKVSFIPFGTKEYWKQRCEYLEKTIDPTRSIAERDNCRVIYKMLQNRAR